MKDTTARTGNRSSDPAWKPDNHEGRLLEFLATLIIDAAQTHPAITQQDVADWIVSVILPKRKVRK